MAAMGVTFLVRVGILDHNRHMSNRTTLAILLSLSALVLFDAMGLVIKRLSVDYHAFELSAYRNFIGLIPAAMVLWLSRNWHRNGRKLRVRQWKLALTRGLILTGAQISFYFALGVLSFATATTITYANALFMTALAVPFLGEQVGWVRWSAVVVGFVGVILIVGPGSDTFSLTALLPLMAAFFYALAGVTARLIDDEVPTALINLYASIVSAFASLTIAVLTLGLTPLVQFTDIAWIFLMGSFGGCAVLLLVAAYRMAEQSDLAPFSYFGIPIAFVMGWAFFAETPWGELFPGALLIVAGGMMIIWRERRLR